jgi:PhnB protein
MAMPQTSAPAAQPEVLGGLVAYLSIDGAAKAAEFYRKAVGAKEVFRHPVDEQGRTMHIHLHVNGSSVMLGDFYPEYGHEKQAAQGFTLQLVVDDVETWWNRAVEAGMEIDVPLQDMFWGDRWGRLRDPFGFAWAVNGPAK